MTRICIFLNHSLSFMWCFEYSNMENVSKYIILKQYHFKHSNLSLSIFLYLLSRIHLSFTFAFKSQLFLIMKVIIKTPLHLSCHWSFHISISTNIFMRSCMEKVHKVHFLHFVLLWVRKKRFYSASQLNQSLPFKQCLRRDSCSQAFESSFAFQPTYYICNHTLSHVSS